jgi:hypothetical protein
MTTLSSFSILSSTLPAEFVCHCGLSFDGNLGLVEMPFSFLPERIPAVAVAQKEQGHHQYETQDSLYFDHLFRLPTHPR